MDNQFAHKKCEVNLVDGGRYEGRYEGSLCPSAFIMTVVRAYSEINVSIPSIEGKEVAIPWARVRYIKLDKD